MKKLINVLLVMFAVWGCSEDDDKRIEDLGLPSDFFYQTVWNGQMSPFRGFEFDIGIVFVSETDGIGATGENSMFGNDYVEFEYSLEGKVLHISRKNNNHTTRFNGYWFLTYSNEALDSLVFEKRVYEDEPSIMTLTKVEYWAGRIEVGYKRNS